MKSRHSAELGHIYGYPVCCVASFVLHKGRDPQLPLAELKLDKTGFVPCKVCNDTKTEMDLIREIVSNRLLAIQFPNGRHSYLHDYAERD